MKTYVKQSSYELVVVPESYPFPYKILPDGRKLAFLHRIIAEKKIGRYLQIPEVVHHIDGNSTNNDPDNLYVCSSQKEHHKIHKYGINPAFDFD